MGTAVWVCREGKVYRSITFSLYFILSQSIFSMSCQIDRFSWSFSHSHFLLFFLSSFYDCFNFFVTLASAHTLLLTSFFVLLLFPLFFHQMSLYSNVILSPHCWFPAVASVTLCSSVSVHYWTHAHTTHPLTVWRRLWLQSSGWLNRLTCLSRPRPFRAFVRVDRKVIAKLKRGCFYLCKGDTPISTVMSSNDTA